MKNDFDNVRIDRSLIVRYSTSGNSFLVSLDLVLARCVREPKVEYAIRGEIKGNYIGTFGKAKIKL